MRIHLAADHAGFDMKEFLKVALVERGHVVIDHGAAHMNPADDYPDVVLPCARAVSRDEGSFGVVIGASGQGEAIAANRIPGVRAVVYYGNVSEVQVDARGVSLDIIASTRAHNNANMLSLGARFISLDDALSVVLTWLDTPFSGEDRHAVRNHKIDNENAIE